MTNKAALVTVSAQQRSVLERLVRARTVAQHVAERCRIVLGSADGLANIEQADELCVDRQRVRRWRVRWVGALVNHLPAKNTGRVGFGVRWQASRSRRCSAA